jgi:hypothetical protein
MGEMLEWSGGLKGVPYWVENVERHMHEQWLEEHYPTQYGPDGKPIPMIIWNPYFDPVMVL